MADRRAQNDGITAGHVAGAVGAVAVGTGAAELYVRHRANQRLGPGFASDTRSLLSKTARAQLDAGVHALDAGHINNLAAYSDYDNIVLNRFARTGEVTKVTGNAVSKVADSAEASRLAGMYGTVISKANEGIAASRLPDGMKVFRAIGTRGVGDLKPGSTFMDPAIQSTTTKLSEADEFYKFAGSKGRNPVMMVVDAGGAKGLSIAQISQFPHEAEVVLPAGTQYHVNRVEKGVRRSLFEGKRDYVFASVTQDAVGTGQIAVQGSRFSRALSTMGKAAKVVTPIVAGAAALAAFSRTGSAAEAGKAATDVVTSGAVSFYDQAKSAGMSDARATAEAVVRGVYNTATFGLFEEKLRVPGAPVPGQASAATASLTADQRQEYRAASVKHEAKRAERAKAEQPKSDGWTEAYVRQQNGKAVQVGGYRTVLP